MARFTKAAIMDAFVTEINERPLDKITVTDLVKDCGINRNTFYYYFHDIYALASAVLERGIDGMLNSLAQPVRFSELFCRLTDYAQKNRRLVYHIYHSNHVLIEQHVFLGVSRVILERMHSENESLGHAEKTLEQLTAFYAYALTGSFLQWLNRGMREPLNDYIEQMNCLLDGSPRAILENTAYLSTQEQAV